MSLMSTLDKVKLVNGQVSTECVIMTETQFCSLTLKIGTHDNSDGRPEQGWAKKFLIYFL